MSTIKILPNKLVNVNNIFCVGKNYELHAKEMGGSKPIEPVIFLKPNSAIINNNSKITLPTISKNIHHEVELVLLIGKNGKNIPKENALEYISGYAVGLDLTMRDIQTEAKNSGNPWAIAKGFDYSAPISDFIDSSLIKNPNNLSVNLKVNGTIRQTGNIPDMIFSVEEIISYLSNIFTLNCGDLIYTGTPEGVAQIKSGDKLNAELVDFTNLEITIE